MSAQFFSSCLLWKTCFRVFSRVLLFSLLPLSLGCFLRLFSFSPYSALFSYFHRVSKRESWMSMAQAFIAISSRKSFSSNRDRVSSHKTPQKFIFSSHLFQEARLAYFHINEQQPFFFLGSLSSVKLTCCTLLESAGMFSLRTSTVVLPLDVEDLPFCVVPGLSGFLGASLALLLADTESTLSTSAPGGAFFSLPSRHNLSSSSAS